MTLDPHDRVFFSRLFLWAFGLLMALLLGLDLWRQYRERAFEEEHRAHVLDVQAQGIAQRNRIEEMLKTLVARD